MLQCMVNAGNAGKISSQQRVCGSYYKKSKTQHKNFKTVSGTSPIYIFFQYIFRGFCVYCVPLLPLRGQYVVLCHPRWLPTSGLTEFAMCWGGAGFEPRTTDLQSGALPLSHLSSSPILLFPTFPLLVKMVPQSL
jgi:hypothetical protein